jgi:hypothetical protein
MQGMLANGDDFAHIPANAEIIADRLIAKLEKKE